MENKKGKDMKTKDCYQRMLDDFKEMLARELDAAAAEGIKGVDYPGALMRPGISVPFRCGGIRLEGGKAVVLCSYFDGGGACERDPRDFTAETLVGLLKAMSPA